LTFTLATRFEIFSSSSDQYKGYENKIYKTHIYGVTSLLY